MTLLSEMSEKTLDGLIERADELFKEGKCCPIKCGGRNPRFCGAIEDGIKVASFAVHDGEEPPVSGWHGAGNVFFSGCSAKCVFCQNWPISQENNGGIYSIDEFAAHIIKLLAKKVHNINLVTSDHYLGKVLRAFKKIRGEIKVPIVYNCNGAQTEELFKIILQISDIFLFDVKYVTNEAPRELCAIKNYADVVRKCLDMLLEKNIPWVEDDLGILQKGLIIRHLVLPNYIDNSLKTMEVLNEYKKQGLNFKISVMSQYFPAYKALDNPKLNRQLHKEEYAQVAELADEFGFDGWIQDLEEEVNDETTQD